ncbi:MAG TPA: MlaD family protein [Candidatus Cloacimonadota bacterium]|nr:MlaD family protein [Candidatus Cloacimonadota bacterium]HQL14821.1 MlaD family protein [Candidatus Cloacimonadota bacterium]
MAEFYKDQRKIEVRVGLIVIVCLIILIAGYAWLRNTLQLKTVTPVRIKFDNAQGIEIGDKVTVNGMETGRVKKIIQAEDGILITTNLTLKYPLRKGAKFYINDSNLMGGKQLDIINPLKGEPLDLKQVQIGEQSYGMSALISTVSAAMQQVQSLLAEINRPNGIASQVNSTLAESQSTFTKVNSVLDENKAEIKSAVEQINSFAKQLNSLLAKNRTKLDNALQQTPELLQKAQTTLDSLQIAASALENAIGSITDGKGTVSGLINDDTLYRNLLQSSARLDSLLADIKANPKRYFQVKVF